MENVWLEDKDYRNSQFSLCECGPEEGDLLSCPNQEYKIYHNNKWVPIDYTEVRDPSIPDWNEYIQMPFRGKEK